MEPRFFHPVFLHFPIVLFLGALVCDLLYWFKGLRVYPAGHVFVIVAAFFTVLTIATSLDAAEHSVNPLVHLHRNWAFLTLFYSLAYGTYRCIIVFKKKKFSARLLCLLTLGNVVLVSMTAYYGGQVGFPYV